MARLVEAVQERLLVFDMLLSFTRSDCAAVVRRTAAADERCAALTAEVDSLRAAREYTRSYYRVFHVIMFMSPDSLFLQSSSSSYKRLLPSALYIFALSSLVLFFSGAS